jgi:hypothetical protein
MKDLKMSLRKVASELMKAAKEVEKMAGKLDAQTKAKPVKKTAGKKVSMTIAKQLTAVDTAFGIIKRYKKGGNVCMMKNYYDGVYGICFFISLESNFAGHIL